MNTIKPNTSIRVAIFNYFEEKGQIISSSDMDRICGFVKDALSQRFQKAILQDRNNDVANILGTSFGLVALNNNINKVISDTLMEVFKDITKEK